ncbi:trehalase [Saprolegnia parasitica CBS 223.65]|uniref:Trehalase n=1 Tax=Saprolegnia parasitica (strain CBS 223.65) TaxID=695850 RepID=A0A067BVS9_SAPPC|nr:trehalase [Saprolegnia parasitica CBS 223.65]KDO18672.1 trehalase [Saprolegnia parasitica CBS 223.65]|eukprot:XP_012210617.1 trehalase [Saprolegnia parasitica CBS 223.65]
MLSLSHLLSAAAMVALASAAAEPKDIYCAGPVLETIQDARLYNDSKHFVDMVMKASPQTVLDAFTQLPDHSNATLKAFVAKYFDEPSTDLVEIALPDFKEHRDEGVALEINKLWKLLGRKRVLPEGYYGSHLPTKHNLVVPGGRFRESYYWDSYWIIHGLLKSDMAETAKGVAQNLLDFVADYGFVPNGGRIYYLNRSQPPLLSDMVRIIWEATKDDAFLKQALPLLEKEYAFWMATGAASHRVEVTAADGTTHVLNRYFSAGTEPRPESFREDMETAKLVPEASRAGLYQNIIAAAESGWDFSSRWFEDGKTMKSLYTTQVVPVDLNAIMHKFEVNLGVMHRHFGNAEKASTFDAAAKARRAAIDAILWSDASGAWKDFILSTKKHSSIVSISDYTPLWAQAYDGSDAKRNAKVLSSLQSSGLVLVAGIQTTTAHTGQQWDAYNAWAPEIDFTVEGLLHMNSSDATAFASKIVTDWVQTGHSAFQKTGYMLEKSTRRSSYDLQFGFGWSNGVILKFLTDYQDLYHHDRC